MFIYIESKPISQFVRVYKSWFDFFFFVGYFNVYTHKHIDIDDIQTFNHDDFFGCSGTKFNCGKKTVTWKTIEKKTFFSPLLTDKEMNVSFFLSLSKNSMYQTSNESHRSIMMMKRHWFFFCLISFISDLRNTSFIRNQIIINNYFPTSNDDDELILILISVVNDNKSYLMFLILSIVHPTKKNNSSIT